MADQTYARPISHVGLTVQDLDTAVDWYGEVLGFELLASPHTVTREDGAEWEHVSSILGVEFDRLTVAHMTTTNDVGFELFEFAASLEGPTSPESTGFNHVGVVDPDVGGLASRIDDAGGSRLSERLERSADGPKVVYCADPWGNRIEIYDVSHGRFIASLDRD